jgi:hypothetical protein
LQGQEQAHNRADKEESAKEINFQNLLLYGQIGRFPFWWLEEYRNGGNGNSSKWQVYLKHVSKFSRAKGTVVDNLPKSTTST